MKINISCVFICVLIKVNTVFCGNTAIFSMNKTEMHGNLKADDGGDSLIDVGKILKRDKRYLLWTNGGISKVVLGFLAPVETRDKVNWRTLNLAYNYQAQYIPIPSTTYLWQYFARDLRNQRKLYEEEGTYAKDLTRELVYGAMELYMDSKGKPGRECLLKSICNAAEHPIVRGGVFEEVIHLILTPSVDDTTNEDYKHARFAGERGEDCEKLYQCKFGDGFLDKFSFLS